MTLALTFVVRGPPVPCARARVFVDRRTKKIRAANPPKTAKYERHVAECAKYAAMAARWPCVDGEFVIWLDVYREANRGDWDNYSKGVADGLKGIVWPDDRMVVEAHVTMHVDRVQPRVEVRIERRAA